MKSDSLSKHAAIAFSLALALYVSFFVWDRQMRLKKGPWEVTFVATGTNVPVMIINEPKLGITNVQFRFNGEQAAVTNVTVVFSEPAKSVPFGKLLFDDLMYLPGTVTLDMFGHEIELLPRTMIVNTNEVAWESGKVIELQPGQKIGPRVVRKKSGFLK